MALIGSDFIERVETRTVYCSECGRKIHTGERSLCSIRKNKVKKRVCSENCRMEFDDGIWQEFADNRENR
jgi:hypothetical protein